MNSIGLFRHYFLLNKMYFTLSRSQKPLKQAVPESAKKKKVILQNSQNSPVAVAQVCHNKLMLELTNVGHLRYAGHISVLTEFWLVIIDVMDFDDEF